MKFLFTHKKGYFCGLKVIVISFENKLFGKYPVLESDVTLLYLPVIWKGGKLDEVCIESAMLC